jgi:hypothetical protein
MSLVYVDANEEAAGRERQRLTDPAQEGSGIRPQSVDGFRKLPNKS